MARKGPRKGHVRPESQFKYARPMTPAERLKYRDEMEWLRDEEYRLRLNMKEVK